MTSHTPTLALSKRQVFLRDTGVVLLLNTGVAVALSLLSFALGAPGSRLRVLFVQWVFAQAIGCSIFGLIEWARLTLWWQRRPGWLALGLLSALAIPIGYVTGGTLASFWLGAHFELPLSLKPVALIVVLITLLTSLAAVYLLTQRDRLEAERLRAENADMRASSARLQLLQQQIEPHMLFNTLANVHALVDEAPERAQALIEALSELLHASMQSGEQPLISLAQEFELLESYLRLMAIRMGPRLAYSVQLPPALAQVRLPPLTLQPLVENAIKHGLDAQVNGGAIRVSAQRVGELVQVEVSDDGVGLQGIDPFGAGRIGLVNLRQRLAYAFGERAELRLADNPTHGVRATLSVPA